MKDNTLRDHSKQKIDIWIGYLTAYLRIMGTWKKNIYIVEPFGGSGKYQEDEGSVLRAAKVIRTYIRENPDKANKIFYKVNEFGLKNYEALEKALRDKNYLGVEKWLTLNQEDAPKFSKKIQPDIRKSDAASLWFVDPYGYTQFRHQDYEDILKIDTSEVMFFLPLFPIYRFLPGDLQKGNLSSIRNFLKDYDINENEAKNCRNHLEFLELIREEFQKSNAFGEKKRYVLSQPLEVRGEVNTYALLFVTKHILGAEKFLEEKETVYGDPAQLALFNPTREQLLKHLQEPRNNIELYGWGIDHSMLPKYMKSMLKYLEDKGKIIVHAKPGERRRKAFYIKPKPKTIITASANK